MVESHEEPETEIPAFLRKQEEGGNIKLEDRLRKHLFAVPDQPDKPRKKVFPSGVTESTVFTVPEVEVPEYLMGREQVNDECEGTYDEDTKTSRSWQDNQ